MSTPLETRKYKQYLLDPSIPMPKATAWRHRKRMNEDPSTSSNNWKKMRLGEYNVKKLNKYGNLSRTACALQLYVIGTTSNNDNGDNDDALMFDDNIFDDTHNGNVKGITIHLFINIINFCTLLTCR